ncbi:MAG: hypothetical protein QXK89_10030 [Candidatus Bathyarchaeia archaeon]
MEEVAGLRKALTARSFIISLIYLLAASILTTFTALYTVKGEVVPVFLLPFIYVPLINAVFGSISPRLRLSAPELALVLIAVFFTQGSIGASHLNNAFPDLIECTITATGAALAEESLRPYFTQWVPDYFFPNDPQIIEAFRNGLLPGQTLDFGKFFPAIAFWSIYSILYFMMAFFLVFGLYGRQIVVEEKLPFPEFQPFIYVVKASEDFKDGSTFSNWLHATRPEYKVFWISFLVGLIGGFWPLITQFTPLVPWAGEQEWGYPDFSIGVLASILPGAWVHAVFSLEQTMLFAAFIPSGSLLTMVLLYVIFGIVYPVVGVQAGILPYEPGIEYRFCWDSNYGNMYPIPYEPLFFGSYLAVGVLALWTVRNRIKKLLSSLAGKSVVEDGLSLKLVSAIGLIGYLGIFVLHVAVGVPVLSSIIMLFLITISYLALAKLYGLFWHHGNDLLGYGSQGYWILPNRALGLYPPTYGVENANYALFATSTVAAPYFGHWWVRACGVGPFGLSGLYKLANETRTNLRDLLLGGLILVIVGVPFVYVLFTWVRLHGGGIAHTSGWGSWIHWWKYAVTGLTGYPTGITGETNPVASIQWHAIGFILFFVFYAIKRMIPGFFFDPFAMAFTFIFTDFIWFCALVALVIRVIAVRVMGTVRWRLYGSSIAIGFAWGWSMTMLFGWIIHFANTIIPSFMSYYVP